YHTSLYSVSLAQRYPHYFPTRRSSDLNGRTRPAVQPLAVFQFLIGRLRTPLNPGRTNNTCWFQFLIGRLRTSRSLRLSYIRYLRSEEHTSELQSRENLVCSLLLEKKKK